MEPSFKVFVSSYKCSGGVSVSMLGMGPMEIVVILVVMFIVLGPERAINAGKTAGKIMRELREYTGSLRNFSIDEDDFVDGKTGGASTKNTTDKSVLDNPDDSVPTRNSNNADREDENTLSDR